MATLVALGSGRMLAELLVADLEPQAGGGAVRVGEVGHDLVELQDGRVADARRSQWAQVRRRHRTWRLGELAGVGQQGEVTGLERPRVILIERGPGTPDQRVRIRLAPEVSA